jgi:hypothetical protein
MLYSLNPMNDGRRKNRARSILAIVAGPEVDPGRLTRGTPATGSGIEALNSSTRSLPVG